MAQLPTRQQEGTPAAHPALLLPAVRALAPGWSYRIVRSSGTVEVREPIPDRRGLALVEVAGQRASKRTTRDVRVLCKSISLRLAHADGTRAYAWWSRLLDAPKWTFEEAAVLPPGEDPQQLTWHEFRAGISWTDDEMEQAA